MSNRLNVLLVEDSEDDACLILIELERGDWDPECRRVETPDEMKTALAEMDFDLVIADYLMPRFNGLEALELLKESGIDIPFILVSGAIGEDTAVVAMRRGAHDYIMKNNLARLAPAIKRELRDAQVRGEHKLAEENLVIYQEKLKNLASQLSLAEEGERRRIAVGLHDQIGQTLVTSQLKLAELQRSDVSQSINASLAEIRDLINQVIQNTRSLVFEISPPFLYDLGLEAAVGWLTERFTDQHGITCEFKDDRQPKPVDEDAGIIIFQAARELLNNVYKHANAQKIEVSIRKDNDELVLSVEDNGVGYTSSNRDPSISRDPGFGLFNIHEKMDRLGGILKIESRPGSWTRVTLKAPLKKEA